MSSSLLHGTITIRGMTARNRIVVSPMCTYASENGLANDSHLIHLGRFGLGGAGIVIVEATAVQQRGRISHQDLGLWDDAQIAPFRRIVDALHGYGTAAGLQLSHAGRKAGRQATWLGAGPLPSASEGVAGNRAAWPVVGPTRDSAGPGWPTPAALSVAEIGEVVQAWQASARRAAQVGFDLIEIHGAHGYLLHSFLSPISNTRDDEYGGSLKNRMRLALETVEAIREVWPDDKPLFYRTSVVDGLPNGLRLEDTFELTEQLVARGVDVLDCSSGGVTHHQRADPRLRERIATHAEFSYAIKQQTDAMVMTVGLIFDAEQAEALITQKAADLVGIGREMLNNPNWAGHSRNELDSARFSGWAPIDEWALSGRLKILSPPGIAPSRCPEYRDNPIHHQRKVQVVSWTVVSTSPSFGHYSQEPLIRLREAGCEVVLLPAGDRAALLDALRGADAWIAGFEPVGAETLVGAADLQVVAKCGAGMDNFDHSYLGRRGIAAVNVPGANSDAVAEYALGQLLALARGVAANDRSVRDGRWGPVVGTGLAGRTLGLVGLGRIGRRVADLARAFGMQVTAHDPGLTDIAVRAAGAVPGSLPNVLRAADAVSLHVPLTEGTRDLVGPAELDLIGPRAFLVNCSRGGIVNETALVQALVEERIAGAALDVFVTEPLPPDSPLRGAPRLLLSAHTAGYSDTALAAVTLQCAENVLAVLEGAA